MRFPYSHVSLFTIFRQTEVYETISFSIYHVVRGTITSLNSCQMIESHLRIHFEKSQVAICLIQTAIPRIYEPKSTHVTIFKIIYDVMKVNKKQLFFDKFYFAKSRNHL